MTNVHEDIIQTGIGKIFEKFLIFLKIFIWFWIFSKIVSVLQSFEQ